MRLAENTGHKYRQKFAIWFWAPSHNFVGLSSQLRHVSTIEKILLNCSISPTCPYNTVNFGPLVAEIGLLGWSIPANFNGICILAVLLHGSLVVGVSQTLRRRTEDATYIRQGGHQIGHWPAF